MINEQNTKCAACLEDKNTPLRRDEMGGYVCLTCIDNKLDELEAQQSPQQASYDTWAMDMIEIIEKLSNENKDLIGYIGKDAISKIYINKLLTAQNKEMREALERVRKHLPALSARPNTKKELGDDIEYADLILAKYPKSVEADDEL